MQSRKYWTILFCLLLMISACSFSAYSVLLNENSPKYTYIQSVAAGIEVGTVSTTVRGEIDGSNEVTRVEITLELQKRTSGIYSTIKTWSGSFISKHATLQKNKLTSPLNTYRLKATFTAYTSTSSETRIIYAYDNN